MPHDRPRPDAGPAKGREALANLKREAKERRLLIDPEQAAARRVKRGPSSTNERRHDAKNASVIFVNASMTTCGSDPDAS